MRCESFCRNGILLFAIVAACIRPVCADDAPKSPVIDVNNSKAWAEQVKNHNAKELAITRQLIGIAEDEKNSLETRQNAFWALGELHNDKTRKFFIENIQLRLHPRKKFRVGDEDLDKWQICAYLLKRQGWAAAPAILESLSRPRSPGELRVFCGSSVSCVLRSGCFNKH